MESTKESILNHLESGAFQYENFTVSLLEAQGDQAIKEEVLSGVLNIVSHATRTLRFVSSDLHQWMYLFERVVGQARVMMESQVPNMPWEQPRAQGLSLSAHQREIEQLRLQVASLEGKLSVGNLAQPPQQQIRAHPQTNSLAQQNPR